MLFVDRVLYGKLHVRSLDWAEPETSERDGQRRAKLHADGIIQVRMLFCSRAVYSLLPGPIMIVAYSVNLCGSMSLMQAGDVASVLHANHGGNLHAFTGKTDCAVLDLFLPPYNRRQGARHPDLYGCFELQVQYA